jgi:hypothetical protein
VNHLATQSHLDYGVVIIEAHVLARRRKASALNYHQSRIIIDKRTLPALEELEDG